MTAAGLFGDVELHTVERRAPLPRSTECESCHAAIMWARTRAGKTMPVDAEPDRRGNVLLVEVDGELQARIALRRHADAYREAGHELHLAHFVQCVGRDRNGRR